MDFWETTSGLFSYSAKLGSTVDTCMALVSVRTFFYGPLYLAVCSVLLPEECVRGFFWETTSGWFVSVFVSCWLDSAYMFSSVPWRYHKCSSWTRLSCFQRLPRLDDFPVQDERLLHLSWW